MLAYAVGSWWCYHNDHRSITTLVRWNRFGCHHFILILITIILVAVILIIVAFDDFLIGMVPFVGWFVHRQTVNLPGRTSVSKSHPGEAAIKTKSLTHHPCRLIVEYWSSYGPTLIVTSQIDFLLLEGDSLTHDPSNEMWCTAWTANPKERLLQLVTKSHHRLSVLDARRSKRAFAPGQTREGDDDWQFPLQFIWNKVHQNEMQHMPEKRELWEKKHGKKIISWPRNRNGCFEVQFRWWF